MLLSTFTYFFTNAQSNITEYETQYKKALLFYQNNEFEKAKTAFGQLSNLRFNNPLVPYSYYFNALSAIKLAKIAEAKLTLQNLLLRFPNWEKRADANYLLAQVAFENKEYGNAFKIAEQISEESLQDDIAEMKRYYIAQLQDTKVISTLLAQYPNESVLKERLQNQNASISSTAAIQQFRQTKGYLNFAFLLPVGLADINPDRPRRANQYVLDMYQGAKLAKAQLQKENISVNLTVYEMSNDPDEMLELMNNSYFQLSDLLVGPLYAETNKYANLFCENNQIPIINPISNNTKLLEIFDKSFLVQPSTAMQAQKAVDFVNKQAFLGRNAAIYYTSSNNDSSMAVSYRKLLLDKGYDIVAFEKISSNSEVIATKIPDKKVSHVFLATSDKKAGLAMLTALAKKENNAPLITTAEAFNATSLSATTVAGREIYCIDPEYIDGEKPEVDKFRKDYLAKYGVIPSYYAFEGYDITLFWGRLLNKYGADFKKGLDNLDTYKTNYSLAGFDYTQSQDNQIVPITTFENYKFVLVK